MLGWLTDTTAATISTMAITETSGRAVEAIWMRSVPNRVCTATPTAIGISTIWQIDQNMLNGSILIHWCAKSQISAGVTSGARIVVQLVMVTDRAVSPRARNVITFDAVPPGQQPTKITPTAMSGGKFMMMHKA